jgi:ABC-type Fe3+ transport system permease subunit
VAVVTDPLIAKYFFRTLVWNFAFAALTVAGTFTLGLLVAIVLNHERLKGQRIYRSLLILPYAMPAFAMLLLWRDMFNTDFGLINRLFGTEINWFGKPVTAMIAVLLLVLRDMPVERQRSSVVERILSPFRAMAAKHTLWTKLPGDLPVVWGDPTRSSRY